jgi:protocatechuate 3,4-dioxygenase beta subunit
MRRALWSLAVPLLITAARSDSTASRRVTRANTVVSGIVYDSIGRAPLEGATVQFVGAKDSVTGRYFAARTDSTGRFTFAAIPPGLYVAGFHHPVLDAMGLEVETHPVEVGGDEQTVPLFTPSVDRLSQQICPARKDQELSGILLGFVRSSDSDEGLDRAVITVGWSESVIDSAGFNTYDRLVADTSTSAGWFAVCNVPVELELIARASVGSDSTGYLQVIVPKERVRQVVLFVSGAVMETTVASGAIGDSTMTSPDSARADRDSTTTARELPGRLSGTVRDDEGRVVAQAQVSLWGSARVVRTNTDGAFILDSLPAGTQTIEVRAIGFAPLRSIVNVSARRVTVTDLVFVERAVVLAPVAVSAQGELVYSRKLLEFERRRLTAHAGYFLTPSQLSMRPPMPLTTVLAEMPGIVYESRSARVRFSMARPSAFLGMAECIPTLFVDGRKDGSFDYSGFNAKDLLAVEIYPREADRPAEFVDLLNDCGAIAIWTRPVHLRRPKTGPR